MWRPQPHNWGDRANEPQKGAELDSLLRCSARAVYVFRDCDNGAQPKIDIALPPAPTFMINGQETDRRRSRLLVNIEVRTFTNDQGRPPSGDLPFSPASVRIVIPH